MADAAIAAVRQRRSRRSMPTTLLSAPGAMLASILSHTPAGTSRGATVSASGPRRRSQASMAAASDASERARNAVAARSSAGSVPSAYSAASMSMSSASLMTRDTS